MLQKKNLKPQRKSKTWRSRNGTNKPEVDRLPTQGVISCIAEAKSQALHGGDVYRPWGMGGCEGGHGKMEVGFEGKRWFSHIFCVMSEIPRENSSFDLVCFTFLSKSKGANPPKQVNTGNVFGMYLACFHRNAYLRVFDWFFPNLTFWYDGWFLNCN